MMAHRKRRNSLRLQGYDYAWEGAYFVTICTHERQHLFGEITDGEMYCNDWGNIVAQAWKHTLEKRSYIQSPASVIMPNHFHALLIIDYQAVAAPDEQTIKSESVGARRASPDTAGAPSQSLGAIVGSFKSAVSKHIHEVTEDVSTIWQRGYHEHIIRNETSYNQIHAYILNNPLHWEQDSLFQVG